MPRKYTPEEAVAAFWAKVDQSGGPDACWPWTGYRMSNGYGITKVSRRSRLAHRVAYTLAVGPIPDGLCVCHACDNGHLGCVNPAHLWLGTKAENSADMVAKGRAASGDRNGSRAHPERQPRGERQGGSRLTTEDVIALRLRHAAGESQQSIADDLGVSQGTVSYAVRRVTWAHVPEQ